MEKKYWMHKSITTITVLILTLSNTVVGQSIILRPSLGTRWYAVKPSNDASNIIDPSYIGSAKFNETTATIGVELKYKKYSYEVVLTSQHYADKFYTTFKGLAAGQVSYDGLLQIQFMYTKFIGLKINASNPFMPFVGTGFGIGFNRPQSAHDDPGFNNFTATSPTDTIFVKIFNKALHSISYSAVVKAGVIFNVKNIERLRVTAIYNFGLNRVAGNYNTYYHNTTKYYATSYCNGSQFSLLFSTPIYLKRYKNNR